MISSYISGRLGNQLFQYAYVRFLLFKRGNKEELQFNFSLVRAAGETKDGFDDSLKFFRCCLIKNKIKISFYMMVAFFKCWFICYLK